MDARLLTRGTNALLVAVVGMGAGHVLLPARPSAGVAPLTAFVALVAGAGALAGARERAMASEYGRATPGSWAWPVIGAVAGLALAWLAWEVVHG